MIRNKKSKKSKILKRKQPSGILIGMVFGILVLGVVVWKFFPKQKVEVFEVGVRSQKLSQQPELWFGVNGRSEEKAYPSDFPALFTSPDQWAKSRAATDVFVFNQSADYLTNIYRDNFFKSKVVPVVGDMEIAFDSIAPAFLSCHAKSVANNVIQADLAQMRRLRDAGLKLRYLKLQSVFNKRMPDNLKEKCGNYTVDRRLEDIVTYVGEIYKEFPDIEVGVVDATHMHMVNTGSDWKEVLKKAYTVFEKAGYKWSFLILDRPYEGVNAFPYSSIVELEQIIKDEWGAKFGIIVTTYDAGRTSNQVFHETALKYVTEYHSAGGRPDIMFLESWQRYPDKLLPEMSTTEYPMTKTLLGINTFINQNYPIAPNGVRSSIRTTVANEVIAGWVRTKDGAAISRQQVVVCIDQCGVTSISVIADMVKNDRGGWFEVKVPTKFFDGKRHVVQAFYVDSTSKQKIQLNQSPFVFYGRK